MGRVVRNVAEEWGFLIRFDKLDGLAGKVVDNVAFPTDSLAIMVEGRTEIVAPVSRSESVILVESAIDWVIGGLGAVVPFTKGSCGVTGFLEHIGNGGFVVV